MAISQTTQAINLRWRRLAILGVSLWALAGAVAHGQELGYYVRGHWPPITEWKVPGPSGWASSNGLLDASKLCALESADCYNARYGPAPKDPWHRGGDQVGERFSLEILTEFMKLQGLHLTPNANCPPGGPVPACASPLDVSDAKLVKGLYDGLIVPMVAASGSGGSSGSACTLPRVCMEPPAPCVSKPMSLCGVASAVDGTAGHALKVALGEGVVLTGEAPTLYRMKTCDPSTPLDAIPAMVADMPIPPVTVPKCPVCEVCEKCPALAPLDPSVLETIRQAVTWNYVGPGRRAQLARALRALEAIEAVKVKP